jgi:malate synthase
MHLVIAPKALAVDQEEVLNPDALHFLKHMVYEFKNMHKYVLDNRRDQQLLYDKQPPFFRKGVRDIDWHTAPVPDYLQGVHRRVEITGPPDRKMVINALNSGANVFMADFEDSLSPTWENLISGQKNLADAVQGTIELESNGKHYRLNQDEMALLMMRPRGLHLHEKNVTFDGKPIPAFLFDLCLYLWHSGLPLYDLNSGPCLYLPKLQHRLEAGLWDVVLAEAEEWLGMRRGSIKVTVLVETLPAAFQTDEIVWELRDRIVGLNCGRWDYIFSSIKTLRNHDTWLLPDRATLGMTQPFLRSYAHLVVQTCQRRGIVPIGGMAAQVPLKDPEANAQALAKVVADKELEISQGFQGTWVAHPGLVPVARAVLEKLDLPPTYFTCKLPPVHELDLLKVPSGDATYDGVLKNVRVGCKYLDSWLQGQGCVSIDGVMEDAATAEISRSQVWQLVHRGMFTEQTVREMTEKQPVSELAKELFLKTSLSEPLPDFLTSEAYPHIS